MSRFLCSLLFLTASAAFAGDPEFAPPVRLVADGAAIRVESPGWAYPCLADLNGDGKNELLVGQFRGGKIKVYRHLNDETFADGHWLQAGGKDVEIPGVW